MSVTSYFPWAVDLCFLPVLSCHSLFVTRLREINYVVWKIYNCGLVCPVAI